MTFFILDKIRVIMMEIMVKLDNYNQRKRWVRSQLTADAYISRGYQNTQLMGLTLVCASSIPWDKASITYVR